MPIQNLSQQTGRAIVQQQIPLKTVWDKISDPYELQKSLRKIKNAKAFFITIANDCTYLQQNKLFTMQYSFSHLVYSADINVRNQTNHRFTNHEKNTLLLLILFYWSTANAATGWYQDYVLFSINNGSNAYYWIGSNPSFGTQLDGNNFGTISTLRITGCDMKYWGTNADRTGGAFYYKIMDASNSTQIVAATEILWTHTAIGGNDFKGTSSTTIDLLGNLSPGTTYKLHIWAKSWGSSQGDSYLSNESADYVATFTTPAYFKSYSSGNWATTSTWYSSNDGTNNWLQSSIAPNASASSATVQTGMK